MKNKTLLLLGQVLSAARDANKEFIDSIIPKDPNDKIDRITLRMAFKEDQYSEQEQGELRDKLISIGKTAFFSFYEQIEKDIQIDMQDHKPSNRDDFFDKNKFVRKVKYSFAIAIFNLSDDFDYSNTPDFCAFLTACHILDWEKHFFAIYGDSFDNNCKVCGDNLIIGLDLDDLKIKMYPAIKNYDHKTDTSVYYPLRQCEHSKDDGEYSVSVDIPSGKIILSDRLFKMLPKEINDECDKYIDSQIQSLVGIDSTLGRRHQADYYAQHNLIYLDGDNASPSVFLNKNDNIITIKNGLICDEDENEVDNFSENESEVGNICMEVWATQGMDYDLFNEYCQKKDIDINDIIETVHTVVVEVPPGRYKATSFIDTKRFEKESIFAVIEKDS